MPSASTEDMPDDSKAHDTTVSVNDIMNVRRQHFRRVLGEPFAFEKEIEMGIRFTATAIKGRSRRGNTILLSLL